MEQYITSNFTNADDLYVTAAAKKRPTKTSAISAKGPAPTLFPVGNGMYTEVKWSPTDIDIRSLLVVRACVDIRTNALLRIPIRLGKILPNGLLSQDHQHPLKHLFDVSPNDEMTTSTFIAKFHGGGHDIEGNALARIKRDEFGVIGVYPVSIDGLTPKRDDEKGSATGNPYGLYWEVKGERNPVPARDIMHVPWSARPGKVLGTSPLQECVNEYQMYVDLLRNLEDAQTQSIKTRDVIYNDGPFSAEAHDILHNMLNNRDKTKPLTLWDKQKYERLPSAISVEDNELNTTMALKVNQLAALYGIHGKELNLKETRTSGADDAADFLSKVIEPLTYKYTEAFNFYLLDRKDRGLYSFYFDLSDFNRTDFKKQLTAVKDLVQYGIITTNEARDKIDMNPVASVEADTLLKPNNIYGPQDQPTIPQETQPSGSVE
jgi:HK97 family phage portal protein